jgi:hypothetical protein
VQPPLLFPSCHFDLHVLGVVGRPDNQRKVCRPHQCCGVCSSFTSTE